MRALTLQAFRASLKDQLPPEGIDRNLEALWYDKHGDWNRAHEIVQETGGAVGDRIHAYLHRKEGDLGNAMYWYSRVGEDPPSGSLAHEWQRLVQNCWKSTGRIDEKSTSNNRHRLIGLLFGTTDTLSFKAVFSSF
jgi:hypothetical protein